MSSSISSNASGEIILSGLPAGSYSDFKVTLDGCESSVLSGPVVLSDPTPATITMSASADPTTCGGVDGAITIAGLESTATYAVSYNQDGTPITTNLVSNASGEITISGLAAGSYSDISVLKDNCTSNTLSGVVLMDPTAPTIALSAVNDPVTCSGQGSIEFSGLDPSTTYTFNFTQNGTNLSKSVTSDASGLLLVDNLDAGLYENMSVSIAGCVSNTITRAVINPPVISLGTVTQPSQCTDSGSFEILGLVVNEPYTLSYTFAGNVVTTAVTSNAAGSIIVGNLAQGSYTDIKVTDDNSCISNSIASVDIIAPADPVVTLGTITDPNSCVLDNGSIQLTGLVPSQSYSVSYTIGGNTTSVSLGTNTSGSLLIENLAAGDYTDIKVTSAATLCESNSLSTTLTLPASPLEPTVSNQEFCGAATIADLVGAAPSGSELLWYDMASGGTLLSSGTSLSSTTYYAVSRDLTTGCESTPVAVVVTIKDIPTFSLGTVSQITTCLGSDGAITLSGLSNSTLYDLSYQVGGSPVSSSISSNASGEIILSGLPAGSYSDFKVTLDGCESSVLSGPVVLSDPTPATITMSASADPTTCGGVDGAFIIGGLEATMIYAVSYSQDGTPITSNLVSNASGEITIGGLAAGNYSNISVFKDNCTSNTLSGVILMDPTAPTIALVAVNDPLTCSGQGSIQFSGLDPSTVYTFNFTQNGTDLSRSVTSDASGLLLVDNLDAGLYENMSVTIAGCVSNTITRAVINPPVISLGTVTQPSQCTDSGSFEILGLVVNEPYTLSYTFAGNVVATAVTSNAAGSIIVNNLAQGSYTDIKVTDSGSCISNSIASVDIIAPAAPVVSLGTITNPNSCVVDNGSIQLTGLVPSQSYNVSYTFGGNTTSVSLGTNTSGSLLIENLAAGDYTDIKVTSAATLCESNTLSTTLTLPAAPSAPTASNQEFCGSATTSDLVGAAPSGSELLWYDMASGGTLLSSGTSLSSTTYYVVSRDLTTGCESTPVAVVVTITSCSDLSIVKTVGDLTPNVGDEITFTIFINNDGPDIATGVDVQDIIPSGYGGITSITNGGVLSSNSIQWTNLTVPLQGIFIQYNAIVLAPTGSSDEYKNVVQITASDNDDPDSTTNNDDGDQSEDDEDAIEIVPQVADLSIIKMVDNANPNVGDIVTFEIEISNEGPDNATNIGIEDVLPVGFTYVDNSVSSNGVYDASTRTLSWSGLNLNANDVTSVVYRVTINEPTSVPIPADEYTNTAQITTSDQYDPDSNGGNDDGDQSEDDEAFKAIVPQIADLSITKTVDNSQANVGDTITFTITVENDGPDDATNVIVTDNLPSGFEYVSHANGVYDPTSGIWNVGTVANGTTTSLDITVLVLAPMGATGEYNNIAEVSDVDQFDPDSSSGNGGGSGEDDDDNSQIELISIDLSLLKTVDDIAPIVNATITFTVQLTNNGPGLATNIAIDETLPSGYEYLSHTTTVGTYDNLTGLWEIASMNSGTSETLIITVKVRESGDYSNTVSVSDVDQMDSDSSNDSSTSEPVPICLTIYNEFSPNNDGVNDLFVIDCIDQYPNNVLEVFNRWGNTVFKKKNYNNTWDGTSNGRATINAGQKLPVGTYYYVLNLGDGSKPKTGWIYINR